MTSWHEIDVNYRDYAKKSELEKTATKLHEFGNLVLQPVVTLTELIKAVEAVQNVSEEFASFCKKSKDILDKKRTNDNEDDNDNSTKKPEPNLILTNDEIGEILLEIMECRIKLTHKMTDQPVKCTSEDAFAQFTNMCSIWRDNSQCAKQAHQWRMPSTEQLEQKKQQINLLESKLIKLSTYIKQFNKEYPMVDDKETQELVEQQNMEEFIDKRTDNVAKIKKLYDDFAQSFKKIENEFNTLQPESDIDKSILQLKFSSMNQNDSWMQNMSRFTECVNNIWKDFGMITSGLAIFHYGKMREKILSETFFAILFENPYASYFIYIVLLLLFFSYVFRYLRHNFYIVYLVVFGVVLLGNVFISRSTRKTIERLKNLTRQCNDNVESFKMINYQLRKINEKKEEFRVFLKREDYIV